jgi:hypothetical protein
LITLLFQFASQSLVSLSKIGRERKRGTLSSYFALDFLDPPLGRSGISPPHLPPPAKDHAKVDQNLAWGGHPGMRPDVRFGSKADITRHLIDVRFTLKSGH